MTSSVLKYRDPATYALQEICPRCGQGWPICVDLEKSKGITHDTAHLISCGIYQWAAYTCGRCSLELALDDDDMRENGLNGS